MKIKLKPLSVSIKLGKESHLKMHSVEDVEKMSDRELVNCLPFSIFGKIVKVLEIQKLFNQKTYVVSFQNSNWSVSSRFVSQVILSEEEYGKSKIA